MKTKNLIVGAGFTGLALAAKLDDYLIVSQNVGGLIRSFEQDGYSFDIGGHVYTTNDPDLNEIMNLAGAVKHENRQAFFISSENGEWIPYPVQESIDKLGIKFAPEQIDDPKSFADFIIKTFGAEFYNEFMRPFNRRVWSTDPADMDFDWISGRVQLPSEKKKNWGPNASFSYARGIDIVNTLMLDVDENNMLVGTLDFVDIECKRAFFTDQNHSQFEVEYDNLYCTTPYFVQSLMRNRVISIGVGLNHRLPMNFHWVYAPFTSPVHRVTLISRYEEWNAPAGCDSLLLEVPFDPYHGKSIDNVRKLLRSNISQYDKAQDTIDLLKSAGFPSIGVDDIATLWVNDSVGYPVPTIGSRKFVADKKLNLLHHDIFLVGRWGEHLYANLDHLLKSINATLNCKDDVMNYLYSSWYYKKT